jgi:hypothetical protein
LPTSAAHATNHLYVHGKGDKPAEVVLNPGTQQAIDGAIRWTSRRAAAAQRWATGCGRITPQRSFAASPAPPESRTALPRTLCAVPTSPSDSCKSVPLRKMQRAARHAKADTAVRYDQSDRSFHRDHTFVLMTATAR